MNPQAGIDDAVLRVNAHPARTRGMIDCATALTEIINELIIGLTLGTRAQFFGDQRSQRFGNGDFA